MKTIMLNPQSKLKVYSLNNRKFKAGDKHKFNDNTARKYLQDEINGVPSFIEVDTDAKAPDVQEADFGTQNTMDRNDAEGKGDADDAVEV